MVKLAILSKQNAKQFQIVNLTVILLLCQPSWDFKAQRFGNLSVTSSRVGKERFLHLATLNRASLTNWTPKEVLNGVYILLMPKNRRQETTEFPLSIMNKTTRK
jgi:hypothetical protein